VRRINRATGPRRGLIVVSRELYTDRDRDEWPADDEREPLRSRFDGRVRTASASLVRALPDETTRRPLLVPEDAVRATRGTPRGARSARLRRAAFGARRAGSLALRSLVVTTCATLAAAGYAIAGASNLTDALRSGDRVAELEATLEVLADQRRALEERVVAGPAGTPPGRLVGAVAGAIGTDDRLRSVSIADGRVTIVIESPGRTGALSRVGAVAGLRVVASETRYTEDGATVTVHAAVDREDRTP